MEKENSDLKKNLIASMDETTSLKEKVKVLDDDLRVERRLTQEKDEQLLSAKEKLVTIAARSEEAFQTTDEYNTVLFSWYFKGFELLRRYLVKHPSGVNMGAWIWRRWIRRWLWTKLLSLLPRMVMLLSLLLTHLLVKMLLLMPDFNT